MVKKNPNMRYFSQNDGKIGIWKGEQHADKYQFTFKVKIMNNAVKFHENMFTISTDHTVESIKGRLREQLEKFRIIPPGIEGNNKKTPKISGKTRTTQDDLAISVLMGPYWSQIAMEHENRIYF